MAIGSLGGCLGSDDHTEGEYTVDIIDRSDDSVVADYHGHWHGDLPAIPMDGHVSLGAAFEDAEGEAVTLEDGRRLDAAVADVDGGSADVEFHGDYAHLAGESPGEVAVVFQLVDGEDTVWETGGIETAVE